MPGPNVVSLRHPDGCLGVSDDRRGLRRRRRPPAPPGGARAPPAPQEAPWRKAPGEEKEPVEAAARTTAGRSPMARPPVVLGEGEALTGAPSATAPSAERLPWRHGYPAIRIPVAGQKHAPVHGVLRHEERALMDGAPAQLVSGCHPPEQRVSGWTQLPPRPRH